MARRQKSRTGHDKTGIVAFGARLTIERLGQRAEGVARHQGRAVYVPHALPGEEVLADIDGERGSLSEVLKPSPERIDPVCPHYGTCGGCALQVLQPDAYFGWKRSLVTDALAREGIAAPAGEIVRAHGTGRRRVTFHARINHDSPAGVRIKLGFMRARSHDIVDIAACPLLCPELSGAAEAGRRIARTMSALGKPLDMVITATETGLDIDIRGAGPLPDPIRLALARLAEALGLARISNHGDIILEREAPVLTIGDARLTPPPGAFLQATVAGEEALAELVQNAASGAKRVADLFAGIGTFALRLAAVAPVHAVESDAAALQALARAANAAGSLKAVATEERDLFRRPLMALELQTFDCVVFDPPRAGAQAQAQQLAQSSVPCVVGVSCNPQTFARDAAILISGGYALESTTPVDQFLYSPHVEMVGVFRKQVARKPRRRLFG
ncbi:MAG: class I SAM-dependent RNA methyltransferase [Hyphomicrobiales bacterium]|nr:class I SAM-dependent RNA methyltransferase [Hyphomicrobiales bacterium]